MGNRLTRPTVREMEQTDPEIVGLEQALLEAPSTSISGSEESTEIHEIDSRGGHDQSEQAASPCHATDDAEHSAQNVTINDLAAQLTNLQQNYERQNVEWENRSADQSKVLSRVDEQQKEIVTLKEEVRHLRDLHKSQEERMNLLQANNAANFEASNKKIDRLELDMRAMEETIVTLKTANSDILNQFTDVILNVTDLVRIQHPNYSARLATIENSATAVRTRLISEFRKFSTVNPIAHRALLERLNRVPEDDLVGTITAIMFAIAGVLNNHEGSINSIQYREQLLMSGFASNNPMVSNQYAQAPGAYVGAYNSTTQQTYNLGEQYL